MFFMMLFAFASISKAQCNLPNVNYNQNQNRIKIAETDRSAVYTFTWGNSTSGTHSMTQKIGMFGGGQGSVTLSTAENNNDPTVYLFGGLKDGDTIEIYKLCNSSPNLLSTITDTNY